MARGCNLTIPVPVHQLTIPIPAQLYAFLWQEVLIPLEFLKGRTVNFLGGVGIRKINRIANMFTGFNRRNDPQFQKSRHVYPGDRRCSRQQSSSHAKWHEVIANGLVDVVLVCDAVNKAISDNNHGLDGLGFEENELLQCYESNEAFSEFEWSAIAPQLSSIFETCVLEFAEESSSSTLGAFLGCSVSNLIRAGHGQIEEAESQPSLENCLVDHDCVEFHGVELNIDRLKQCMGLSMQVRFSSFDS